MDTHIPTIAITADQVGPLGLTLGCQPDPGGGRPLAAHVASTASVPIPAHTVRWLDERATCSLVQAFVHGETLPDLAACPAYAPAAAGIAHYCRRSGRGTPCAFHEAPEAPVWVAARHHKRIPLAEPDAYGHTHGYLYDPHNRYTENGRLRAGQSTPQDAGVA